MRQKPTPEQIAKLPKWAQDHIDNLERRTLTAEKKLREWTDQQTESPFRIDEIVCVGDGPPERMTRYIQSHKMGVAHAGILMGIVLRNGVIDVSYDTERRTHVGYGSVALIPRTHQQFYLEVIRS